MGRGAATLVGLQLSPLCELRVHPPTTTQAPWTLVASEPLTSDLNKGCLPRPHPPPTSLALTG